MADWRTALCHAVGGPASARTLHWLDLWARSEAVPVGLHNPLGAAIWDFQRNRWVERDTVIGFPSSAAAVNYYRRLFNEARFSGIALAIEVNASSFAAYNAIHDSQWRDPDYQSRKYPVLLYRFAITPPTANIGATPPLSEQAKSIFRAWHDLSHELHTHVPRQLARAKHWSKRLHSAVR